MIETVKKTQIIEVTKDISFIKATKEPLSADVAFIKAGNETWIYDCGADDYTAQVINEITGVKNVVLSHFHPDHTQNINRITCDKIYGGKNTAGYFALTDVITESVDFGQVQLIPVQSSHAKGCVALKAGEYLFLGDTTYAAYKNNQRCYNAQKLKQTLETLKSIDAKYFCLSHDRMFVRPKDSVIMLLEHIYGKTPDEHNWIYL